MTLPSAPATPAPARLRFGALHHRDDRRYIVTTVVGLIAENIEHVIGYLLVEGLPGLAKTRDRFLMHVTVGYPTRRPRRTSSA